MLDSSTKTVIIVGGSIGGLMTGIVFVRLGHNVTILERTPAATLQDQGAGISLRSIIPQIREAFKKLGTSGAPIADFLDQYDRTKTPTLSAKGFQYLNRDGSIKMESKVGGGGFRVTSWDLLYNILRANYDGGFEEGYIRAAEKAAGDGTAKYLTGTRVIDLQEAGDLVKVEYESEDGKCSLEADIVVGADGPSSTVRKLLLPEIERKYVGYVIWRGTVKESLLTEETRTFLGTKVRFRLRCWKLGLTETHENTGEPLIR
jgi:2-polyprenyl-6-methoxyphenol hydroxylase-like FAD-dependent oxidoreductase